MQSSERFTLALPSEHDRKCSNGRKNEGTLEKFFILCVPHQISQVIIKTQQKHKIDASLKNESMPLSKIETELKYLFAKEINSNSLKEAGQNIPITWNSARKVSTSILHFLRRTPRGL